MTLTCCNAESKRNQISGKLTRFWFVETDVPVVSRGWAGLGGSRSADFGRRGGGVGAAVVALVGPALRRR